ncbi:MAG TPA: hypothetical protein VGW40_06250 [Allosphingosinicella sp.]|nr:hypothetical protein [Allosphingosinicella sp.]
MRIRIGLACFAIAAAGPAASSVPGDPQSFAPVREAAAAALRGDDGGFLAGPEMPALVERWWVALRRWTGARFDWLGPGAARTLTADVHRLDAELDVVAVPLGRSAFLVSAGKWGFGTLFVLGGAGGRHRTLWSAPGAAPLDRAFRSLESWAPDATVGHCPGRPQCNPLGLGHIGLLPPGAGGRPRFYVQATYRSEMGATVGGQLSIWEWDGAAAHPLMVRDFAYMADQRRPVLVVDGAALTLHVKGDFGHFYACGSCEGRQMKWRFRAGPGGIADLGRESLTPELDFVDALIERMSRGRDTADLSDPAPAAALRRIVLATQSSLGWNLGMISGWRASGPASRRRLCLGTDEGGDILLTIARGPAGPRLLDLRPLAPQTCSGAGANM